MKIPDRVWIDSNEVAYWHQEAKRLRMVYGIYIEVKEDFAGGDAATASRPTRIYFVVDKHEFESLNDLEKALKNKAFL